MDEIKETLKALSQFTQEPNSVPDSTRADKVWVQLAELFGKAFYREHGSEPGNLWIQAINKLRDDQIAQGLANLANDNLSFPANLSMFVSACKRQREIAPTRPNTYLPPPEMDRRLRAANLTLLKVLGNCGGVDRDRLRCLVGIKNEMAKDWPLAIDESHIKELRAELEASL